MRSQKLFLAIIILLTSANFVFTQNQEAQKWLDLGNQQGQAKDFNSAIRSFSTCIKIESKAAACYFGRGFAYFQLKQFENAIEDFSVAIRQNPNYADAYLGRMRAYCFAGKVDLATAEEKFYVSKGGKLEDTCQNFLAKNPQFAKQNKSNDALSVNKPESVKVVKPAPQPTPNADIRKKAGEYASSASKLEGENDLDGAIRDYTKAIDLDSNDPNKYSWRARVYERKNMFKEAYEDSSKAIALAKSNPYFYYAQRSNISLKLKKHDEALSDINQAIQANDKLYGTNYLLKRVEIYTAQKKYDLAMSEVNKVNGSDIELIEPYNLRAAIKIQQNDINGAIADYTEIIDKYGSSYFSVIEALEKRAEAYKKAGNNTKAKEDVKAAQNGKIIGDYYGKARKLVTSAIGKEAPTAQDYNEAVKLYNSAVAVDPTYGFTYLARGRVYLKLNQSAKALEDFQKVIKYAVKQKDYRTRAAAYEELAKYYYEAGDYQLALVNATKNIETNEIRLTNTHYELRGDIYFALKQYQNAVNDYSAAKSTGFKYIKKESEERFNIARCNLGQKQYCTK